MKLFIDKPEGVDIVVHMEINGERKNFQYPEFIQKIYDGEIPIETEFSSDISEEQQEKLKNMISQIESVTVKKRAAKEKDS